MMIMRSKNQNFIVNKYIVKERRSTMKAQMMKTSTLSKWDQSLMITVGLIRRKVRREILRENLRKQLNELKLIR